MNKSPELLPLGSAVEIDDDESVYVVIARGFQKHEDGFLAGYKAVPHPRGAAAGVREIVIRQTQITKVLHRGHEDKKDADFAKELLESATTPPKAPPPPVAEPDLTVDLAAPASAPPTAAPESPTDVVIDPKDPFSQLRRKGKRA